MKVNLSEVLQVRKKDYSFIGLAGSFGEFFKNIIYTGYNDWNHNSLRCGLIGSTAIDFTSVQVSWTGQKINKKVKKK